MEVRTVDLGDEKIVVGFKVLMKSYSGDIMGGEQPLSDAFLNELVVVLRKRAGYVLVMAFDEGQAIGMANCFEGFSTFKAKPLLNIHDLVVEEPFRGKGIGSAILRQVVIEAERRSCCKLTLEVLEGNKRAINVYEKNGFEGYSLDPEMGKAMFMEKVLG